MTELEIARRRYDASVEIVEKKLDAEEARSRFHGAIRDARGAGLSLRDIARLASLSVETVRRIAQGEKPNPERNPR